MAALIAEDLHADLVSASHWVGLTLPGMIEEPGSFSGSDSSPRPERGPEPRKRMSLAILNSEAATVLMAPWLITMASWAASASNLLGAVVNGRPVMAAMRSATFSAKPIGRIEAGADGGAALGQLHQRRQRLLDARDAVLDLLRVAGELLAERQRRCILRMGAADLDDVRPGLAPCRSSALRRCRSAGSRRCVDLLGAGDVHGRRIGVVRRLAHVDVVVGMHGLLRAHLAAQHLDGAVGDHLVGVHVRLGAGAGLPDDQREVIVELAVDHFLRGRDDGLADLRVEAAERHVGFGGGALDDAERAHDRHAAASPSRS